jgi:hypothetical protein
MILTRLLRVAKILKGPDYTRYELSTACPFDPDPGTTKAFSSEVEAGSREENASKQKARAPVLIQSEPIWL